MFCHKCIITIDSVSDSIKCSINLSLLLIECVEYCSLNQILVFVAFKWNSWMLYHLKIRCWLFQVSVVPSIERLVIWAQNNTKRDLNCNNNLILISVTVKAERFILNMWFNLVLILSDFNSVPWFHVQVYVVLM